MKCLVCQKESDGVAPRELPWKITRKMMDEATKSRLLPQPVPAALLEKDEIAVPAPLCDACHERVASGDLGLEEFGLRILISRTQPGS